MTCASCAARIEKKLNRIDGVEATVNYATEKARIRFSELVDTDALIATVEATGYTATLPPSPAATAPSSATGDVATAYDFAIDEREREAHAWKTRLTVSALLTAPVVAMSMIPALQLDNWQWISLTLASPVVVW